MARLDLERVSKVFPLQHGQVMEAVRDITLRVGDGELIVLLGPSGCGKTTTLRLIAGLEKATCGSISIDGHRVNEVAPKDRDVAMVFQQDALYPHMSVYENMAFGLRLRGHAGAEIDRRVHEASEAFGLTGLLPRRPETLSGGERQRVAIVRALAREPKVLLLDEPFSNLDTPMRAQVRLELKRVHQRLEATIVHVTHDQAEALTLGDRVAVMRRGRIEQVASPLTLYDAPANLFVAGFVGWPPMNFVRGALGMAGEVCQFKIEAGSGTGGGRGLALPIPPTLASELSAHVGRTLVMGLRPEDIGPARDHPSEARGTDFESQVEWVEVVVPELHVHLSACGWRCLARWPRQDAPSAGEKVHASVAAGRAHFFDPETGLAIGGRVLL